MASVSLEGVSKKYPGGVTAVDDLHLQVEDSELLVLVGPSGCGKSTTLRMIAGLEEPTSGVIRIGERDVTRVAPKDRNIAMVFQNYALYPHMSVYKNMAFGLQLRYGGNFVSRLVRRVIQPQQAAVNEQRRGAIKEQVHEAARLLGIEHLLRRMPRQLSGGERQRVAVGRAIVREPAAFLFDEPLSNLDARLRIEMRGELKRLHQRLRTTMIYVTHDQVEALTLGDRVVVMDGGRVQQVGPPMEIYDRPQSRFVAGFVGSPPMNFIGGKLAASGDQVRFVGDGWDVALTSAAVARLDQRVGQQVVLGVRPEDVRAVDNDAAGAHLVSLAKIVMVEALGDSAILHLQTKEKSIGDGKQQSTEAKPAGVLLAKADARSGLKTGDEVAVSFVPERLHVFAADTGKNLTLAAAESA